MIELKEREGRAKELVVVDGTTSKVELKEYLGTYVRQYNEMVETFAWMREQLTKEQVREWRKTISALEVVCRTLDAGFDPIVPPKNWSSGQLFQYIAPIPEQVREKLDLAVPIFGKEHILIYDPNEEHFARPKNTDPLAVGFVDLARQRLHFCVGQWDLAADLKFIDKTERLSGASDTVGRLMDAISASPRLPDITAPWHRKKATEYGDAKKHYTAWRHESLPQARYTTAPAPSALAKAWVSSMYSAKANMK